MPKVTFDSNVFQPVVRPDKFPNDKEAPALWALHDALKNAKIDGFIAETMADLEAIRRADRAVYFSTIKPDIKFTETELPDGQIKISMSVGSKTGAHPGLHQVLSERFADGLALGIKFMRCPRIGLPRPTLVQDTWFAPEAEEDVTRRHDDFCAALRAIEARNVGRAVVEQLGKDLAKKQGRPDATWFQGLAFAQDQQGLNRIADAVGEWADGDAVAAHIAYRNDLFCTRDQGISAGTSVLAPPNRSWLSSVYGIVFVTPAELAARLS